jgi:hypothetical protein
MKHIIRITAIVALLGGGGGATAQNAGPPPAGKIWEERAVVKLAPGQRIFSLGKDFIFDGSLTLTAGGTVLRPGSDYLADFISGTIYLKHALSDTATVMATFSSLPFELKESYTGPVPWKNGIPGAGGGIVKGPPSRESNRKGPDVGAASSKLEQRSGGASLTVGGSKRLAVEFGTGRDVAFSQSLDLDITGKVSDDVEIKAILSDRNLPLLPEGNTQTLEELDEVLVRVSSPGVQATFGDYTLNGPSSEFGNFTRSVEGVQASASKGDGEIRVATASSRGKYASVEFMGEEGKQGAYVLTGGTSGATLVPGGEKVWLDGELMRRGAAADYVIDYGAGSITFTSGRPITKDSRITVDYEYSAEAYRRSLYSAVGRTRTGPLKLSASYASENDDRGSSLGQALTEEERNRLEAIGDGSHDAGLSDTTGAKLQPPSSHELVDVGLGYEPWSVVSIETELAVSDQDLNTLSGRDDGDNRGTAFSLKANMSPVNMTLSGNSLGSVEASASFRETGSTFSAMGRTDPAMDYDRWNLSPDDAAAGKGRAEMAVTYRPTGRVALGAEVGRLAVNGGPESQVVRFMSTASGRRGYALKWERAETDGGAGNTATAARDRALAQLRWGAGPLAPLVEVQTEHKRSPGGMGLDYTDVGGELVASGRGAVTRAALHVREDFGVVGGARSRESRSLTQSYGVSYRSGLGSALEGRYSLRSLAVDSTGASVNTYVAYFDGTTSALKGALGCKGTYEVTSTDEGPRTVIFVGPGKGHYDSDGRYVGLGDYELSDNKGSNALSSRVTVSLSTDLDWGRVGRSESDGFLSKVLSNLRSSGSYRSDENTRLPVASPAFIFRPGSYMSEADVIRGTSVAWGDLEIFPRGRALSPRVRYEVRKKLQNASGDDLSGSRLRLVSLRARTRALPRGTFETEQVWGRSETEGSNANVQPTRTSETKATLTMRAGPRTSFSFRSSLLSEVSPSFGGSRRLEVEPSATYSSPGRASVEARCAWARASQGGSRLYDELLGWLGDRVEYSLSGQLTLGGGVTLTGTLQGTGVSWGELSHYLRMEMRALF